VDPSQVETNILLVEFTRPAKEVVTRLASLGVLLNPTGAHSTRMVCHLDVSAADIDEALSRIRRALES
jgi:threonine aldolase